MNISFRKSPVAVWLTLAEIVVGIGVVITESLLGYHWLGTFSCVIIPIVAFIVLALGTFIDFKDTRTKDILYIVGLVAICISLMATMNTSFTKMSVRLNVINLSDNVTSTIEIITGIIFAVAHIFFIMFIVAYGIFIFSRREKKDVWNIVKVSTIGLLSAISVLAIFELIIHFFRVSPSYRYNLYEYYPYIVTELFSAALIFLIAKSSYFELSVPVKKGRVSSSNSSNTKSISITDEMKKTELVRKYKELLDNGVITEEDFKKKRDELMK